MGEEAEADKGGEVFSGQPAELQPLLLVTFHPPEQQSRIRFPRSKWRRKERQQVGSSVPRM